MIKRLMAYLCFGKARRRMDVNSHGILDSPVGAALLQLGCVVEKAGCYGFPDGIMFLDVGGLLYLNPVHQALQLIPHIPSPLHAPDLHDSSRWAEIFVQTSKLLWTGQPFLPILAKM